MKEEVSIFIYCQAFGWDEMQEHKFLSGLAENRASMRPVLNTACASLPTVVTGKHPGEHGIFAWYIYGPDSSPFRSCRLLAHLPLGLRTSNRFRRIVDRAVRKSHGFMGRFNTFNIPLRVLPLFDVVEKRNLLEPGAFDGAETLFDIFVENRMNYFCSRWDWTDPENADALEDLLELRQISAAFCFLDSTEYVLQRYGCDSFPARSRFAWIDHRIRRLYETAARNYSRVNLIAFSDSGMIDAESSLNLPRRLQANGHTYGKDYVAFYEPVMARFWFMSDRRRDEISDTLQNLPMVKIMTREELQREQCWFADNRFGELIVLANPGTVLFPNFINGNEPLAAYGYAADAPGIEGGFVCNMAGVEPPEDVAGLFNIMQETVLGRRAEVLAGA